MVDDHTRLAYAEVLPTLTARCAIEFLRRGLAWFAEHGVQIKAVMSDNGSAYVSHAYRQALAELGLRHLRIRPYRPRTNGKAERFIQTLLREWSTSASTAAHPSVPTLCRSISSATTSDDHTALSATSRPRHG
jgi:transposase InsO family protein